MSEQELLRFTPKLLTPQQVSALCELFAGWHGVYLDEVGAGQLGVIGLDQRHGSIIRQAAS
jgi:hypothetical protein